VKRLGSHPAKMRKLQASDIFFSRLQLLVVMSKAFLKDYQLGEYRAAAVINNAARLSEAMTGWEGYKTHLAGAGGDGLRLRLDHILFQRIKLLLTMAESFAAGDSMGPHRKMALKNNIDYIADALHLENQAESIPVLSVA